MKISVFFALILTLSGAMKIAEQVGEIENKQQTRGRSRYQKHWNEKMVAEESSFQLEQIGKNHREKHREYHNRFINLHQASIEAPDTPQQRIKNLPLRRTGQKGRRIFPKRYRRGMGRGKRYNRFSSREYPSEII